MPIDNQRLIVFFLSVVVHSKNIHKFFSCNDRHPLEAAFCSTFTLPRSGEGGVSDSGLALLGRSEFLRARGLKND